MIPIKRNHFYTKEILSNAVGVLPQFKDLPVGASETTLEFKGGLGATQYVVSGNVSETPKQGASELTGGFVQYYVTGMSISGSSTLPELEAYRVQNNFPLTEGEFSLATGTTMLTGASTDTGSIGADFWFSESHLEPVDSWLEENFDGSNKSMGANLVLPGGGTAQLTLDDAYVTPTEGAEQITYGGDAFFGGGANNDVEHNLGKYYSLGGPDGARERVEVRPVKKNHIKGLWSVVNDWRNDKQKWQIYLPYWKWEAIRPILKFDKVAATTENTEAEKDANPENTIFNKLAKNNDTGNYLSYGEAPLFSSTMKLVPSDAGGIGQSLEMLQQWTPANDGSNYWNTWFKSNSYSYPISMKAPQQQMWASIYNIPYPLANNIGAMSQTLAESGAMAAGDQRVVFPEININMKIDQLLPAPAIDLAATDLWGSTVVGFGDDGSASDDATQIRDSATCDIDITGSELLCKPHNKTFWRSVVITFSNYKPSQVSQGRCSLDQFLEYGLKRAYGNISSAWSNIEGVNQYNESNLQIGPKIVTGIVFESFYSASGSGSSNQDGSGNVYIDPDAVYAYSLPVQAMLSGTLLNKSTPMLMTEQGDNWFVPAGAMLHGPVIGRLAGAHGDDSGIPYVKLPKQEFFNVKFVFDVQQPWGQKTPYAWYKEDVLLDGSDGVYSYDTDVNAERSGVPIRAYFDTQTSDVDVTDDDDFNEDDEEEEKNQKPYLNLGLPLPSGYTNNDWHSYMSNLDRLGVNFQTADLDERKGNPSLFPKHMTIWVSNFGLAPARTTTPFFWASERTWFDSEYWVSDDYAFPIVDAASNVSAGAGTWTGPNPIETKLLIDTITFKHWNAPVNNMSTGAGTYTRFMQARTDTIASPAGTIANAGDTNSTNTGRIFNNDGSLNQLAPGQNFTLGFKNWDWFPQVEAAPLGGTGEAAQAGYMLFNNFSSKEFGLLERKVPTAAWISSNSKEDDTTQAYFPGYQMYGNTLFETATPDDTWQATQDTQTKVFVTGGVTTDPTGDFGADYEENAYIQMGEAATADWMSTDSLTQKGFMKFTISSGNSSPNDGWVGSGQPATNGYLVPRENVLTSAKITSIAGSAPADGTDEDEPGKNVIMVDNIDIFQQDMDDEYIIYRAGEYLFAGANILNNEAAASYNKEANCTHKSNSVTCTGHGASVGMAVTSDESAIGLPLVKPSSYIIDIVDSNTFKMSRNASYTKAGATLTFYEAARSALGYKHIIKMVERDIVNSTVKLSVTDASGDVVDKGILKADDNVTSLCIESNLYQLYISPKRYWINMLFSGDEWATNRQYENMCMVNEVPDEDGGQLGTTFNEALYTYNTGNKATKGLSAIKEHPWILGVSDEKSALILSEDFGYGSYDGEKNTGGQAGKMVPVLNRQNYMDISKMVKAVAPAPTEEVTLLLGMTDTINTKSVTIVGDDNTALDISGTTYYRPQYVWEYFDELPAVTNFKVQSQFDVLSPDVNLYELTKEPINNLKFTWDETGDDIWYRHLLIDASGSIENKYHRANFWIPFNEYGLTWTLSGAGTGVTSTSAYTGPYTFYEEERNPTTDDLGFRTGSIYSLGYGNVFEAEFGQLSPTVNGISGYAPWFGGGIEPGHEGHCGPNRLFVGSWENKGGAATSYDYELDQALGSMTSDNGESGGGNPWTEEWSLVIHCNPSGAQAYKIEEGGTGMTVCGIQANQNGFRTLDDAAAVTITAGNRDADGTYMPTGGGAGSLTWTGTKVSGAGTAVGGFDLLHVFLKHGRVCVQYNHEYSGSLAGDNVSSNRALTTGAYEAVALASARNFPMDGSLPLSILITFNKRRGTTDSTAATTDITSNDEFRLYVNGQLEDSESLKYSSDYYQLAASNKYPPLGGFGRTNYNKFIIGCFNTLSDSGDEWNVDDGGSFPSTDTDYGWGGPPTKACNITAACGGGTTSNMTTRYNQDEQRYIGTIEEIILYPYEILNVESATEYITDTRGFPDYGAPAYGDSADVEKNYNARLFVFDHTNIRGKSTTQVASTNNIQWKVTGV